MLEPSGGGDGQERDTVEVYVFKYSYLDGQTQEYVAERLDNTDRTVRRWITELTGILSI